MTLPDPDDLVQEQIDFYRYEAAAYDAWLDEVFARGGGGAKGEATRREWQHLGAALREFGPQGQVLEVAAGTGAWTRALLQSADHVTLVDASRESLELARARLGAQAARASFVQADLFQWRPPRRYDSVFFAFWLTHVPPSRFDSFWGLVADALEPSGRVFFIDSLGSPVPVDDGTGYREDDHLDENVSVRELHGRRYHVVKAVWEPDALEARLASLGWCARVERSDRSIWGTVARSAA